MKFRIHFTTTDGGDDSFVIEEDDIEQLRERAEEGVQQRHGSDPWSEQLED